MCLGEFAYYAEDHLAPSRTIPTFWRMLGWHNGSLSVTYDMPSLTVINKKYSKLTVTGMLGKSAEYIAGNRPSFPHLPSLYRSPSPSPPPPPPTAAGRRGAGRGGKHVICAHRAGSRQIGPARQHRSSVADDRSSFTGPPDHRTTRPPRTAVGPM